MIDYIERGALKEYLYGGKFQDGCTGCDEPGEGCIECIVDEIDSFSAADVAPVRRGHWKRDRENRPICSECAEEPYRNGDYNPPNYCPNCGARMEVPNDD